VGGDIGNAWVGISVMRGWPGNFKRGRVVLKGRVFLKGPGLGGIFFEIWGFESRVLAVISGFWFCCDFFCKYCT
jgi:hypothetical protein